VTEHQRACAHCGKTPAAFSVFWFGSDFDIDRRDMRVLCHPCVRQGWAFDSGGIARLDPARAVDGGTRRAVNGLMRGSVGMAKERR